MDLSFPPSTCFKISLVTFGAFMTVYCCFRLFILTKLVTLFTFWNCYYCHWSHSSQLDHLLYLKFYYLRNYCASFTCSLTDQDLISCINFSFDFENLKYLFSTYFYFLSTVGLTFISFSFINTYRAYCFASTWHMHLFFTVYDGLMLIIIVFFIVKLVIATFFIFLSFFLQPQ